MGNVNKMALNKSCIHPLSAMRECVHFREMRFCSIVLAVVISLFCFLPMVAAQTIQVLETRADQTALLARHQISFGSADPGPHKATIRVDERIRFQSMDGFGASLTDSSASILSALSPKQREDLMHEMFDPRGPLAITLLRQPIGASDFSAHGDYSYDDPPGNKPDLSLANFGPGSDEQNLFPLLREATHLNPQLRFILAPWSAPAWMKGSHVMNGGSLEDQFLPVYAQYLARSVDLYAAEGLSAFALALQNEPLNENDTYPTQHMAPSQEVKLASLLRLLLWKNGRSPLLLGYEHNWDNLDYPLGLLDQAQRVVTPGSLPLFAGISFHCYAGNESAQLALLKSHPEAGIWLTECTSTNETSFADDLLWEARHLLLGSPMNGARSVLFWNLLLNTHGGPHNGGCQDCSAVLRTEVRGEALSVQRGATYYELAHAAPFIHPGATHIASSVSDDAELQTVAFQNLDGTIVLLALSQAPRQTSIAIAWSGRTATYTVPPRSLMTFFWGDALPVVAEGTYHICSDAGGRECLEAQAGSSMAQWSALKEDPGVRSRQLWTVHRLPGNRFEIRNLATAQVLVVTDGSQMNTLSLDGSHVAPLTLELQADTVCFLALGLRSCAPSAVAFEMPQAGTWLHFLNP